MAGLIDGLRTAAGRPISGRERLFAIALIILSLSLAVIVFPDRPAAASPASSRAATVGFVPVGQVPAALCSVEEWQADIRRCMGQLPEVAGQRTQCVKAPTPDAPDTGLAGWFASRPDASRQPGQKGFYTEYGYAGYSYTTYDIGCVQTLMHPDYKFENTVANGEFMIATAVVGASNALRERAWEPGVMWGWADPLVEKATRSVYTRVFTVFGVVTLAIVGLYLLWRSRQAHMSAAMTTAGWAILVMVVVTALAAWPVFSAHMADNALVSSLNVVHDAVGPPSKAIPPEQCRRADKASCQDIRPPAVRASDTAVETMLYRNWLRGVLGSSDSVTAQKYGLALYQARTLTWAEVEDLRAHPELREKTFQEKSQDWIRVAEQVRTEDPEAYEYLTGTKGMERIGAGFIALLAAIMFALFDITASLLVLLGFLIFRWAVIAAPILGTIGMLRPASGGFRRLLNAVVAALFNIVIFGTGAAIYLFAVDLIMNTGSLPGWLQVVLVWLCGVVGWLLLRPYRRVTQLGGRDPAAAIASGGSWHRRFFRDLRETAPAGVAKPGAEPGLPSRPQRVEVRVETPTQAGGAADAPPEVPVQRPPQRRMPVPSDGGWSEPVVEQQKGFALYRPTRSGSLAAVRDDGPDRSRVRAEARQDA
jgi:hypothetical protein